MFFFSVLDLRVICSVLKRKRERNEEEEDNANEKKMHENQLKIQKHQTFKW